jgi:putative nucleotidyltransferase with HDIG domain
MADTELSKYLDVSHPLMELFKKTAPGTQKHCLNVAAFCESIARDLNLKNPDMLKCAALYHDIGKTVNPMYFTENQSGVNPHDDIKNPHLSFQLISRHIPDTVFILHQYKFPIEIIDIASEHHGDSVLSYFYNIAKKQQSNDLHPTELIKQFRYRSPRPKTAESAILMICDRVEATARSKFMNAPKDVQVDFAEFVHGIINELKEDGQLDNMKIGTCRKVEIILSRELASIYHSRIAYPAEPEDEDDQTIGETRPKDVTDA